MKPPVIICALGGSGTRVVARIIRDAGYFCGTNRNESEDAMDFVEFYDRWINRYILRSIAPFSREEEELMISDFQSSVSRHRAHIPAKDAPWGWKEPRSHFLLPFFHAAYPQMKLIHVIRDGRDMAFSQNQNQLRKHGALILNPPLGEAPQPIQTAALWAKINLSIAEFAETHLAGLYLLIRFEVLCAEPWAITSEILNFLECSNTQLDPLTLGIGRPQSIGRWQRIEDLQLIDSVQSAAEFALRKFDYQIA